VTGVSPSRHVAWDRVAITGGCLLFPLGLAVATDSWVALWGLLVGIDLAIVVGLGRPTVEVFDGPAVREASMGRGEPGDSADAHAGSGGAPTGSGDVPPDGSDT